MGSRQEVGIVVEVLESPAAVNIQRDDVDEDEAIECRLMSSRRAIQRGRWSPQQLDHHLQFEFEFESWVQDGRVPERRSSCIIAVIVLARPWALV